jgi:hypothetical protein
VAKDRGQKPARPAGKVPARPAEVNYDEKTPKFCLHYLVRDFGLDALDTQATAAFARTLHRVSCSSWRELLLANHKGQGYEFIPAGQIRAPIPPTFQDSKRFMMFRYSGNLPMGGERVQDVLHVLWVERHFGELYDHGSS